MSVSASTRHSLAAIALVSLLAATSAVQASQNAGSAEDRRLCVDAIAEQERRHGIPYRLLHAVSLVESGQWDAEQRETVAWPWTIYAEGRGRYLPSKQVAVAEVNRLQARGVRNIDVGCMQVNLMYHPNAFASLDDAFDPEVNAAYAADFLVSLKDAHGSWNRAVQHYHSATPQRHGPYQKRVWAAWRGALEETAVDEATRRRLQRVAHRIERDHRAKLRAYEPDRPDLPERGEEADRASRAPVFLSHWPPRNVNAQRRAESLARSWAFSPR